MDFDMHFSSFYINGSFLVDIFLHIFLLLFVVLWHARNLSDPRPFTARKYSIYKYFRQYRVEYSSIWVPQGVLEYLGEYLEYLSTQVLSLSLGTKLKL